MPKVKMSDAAKKARADYIREWRKKNPDKTAAYAANHWERVAAEHQAAEDQDKAPDNT